MNINKIPIDVVYTWVDRADPKWVKKYHDTVKTEPHYNRYGNFGELFFSIQTVRKFAPFVRNIYVVTDDQIPTEFDPEKWKIKIIDHSTILGKECCRPTFKSNSIEAYLYKIPNLSDYFWYFNDDTCLGKKINKEQLFTINRLGFNVGIVDFYQKNIDVLSNKKYLKRWRYAIYNAHLAMYNKFHHIYNYSFTHQATMLSKQACHLTWELFKPELSKSVSTAVRNPAKDTIHFILLSQLVAIEKGFLKPRVNIPFKLRNLDVKTIENAKSSFKTMLIHKPHFMCFNNLTPILKPSLENSAPNISNHSNLPNISKNYHKNTNISNLLPHPPY